MKEKENIIQKYNVFKSSETHNWVDKMVWSKGKCVGNTCTIDKFLSEYPLVSDVRTTDEFFAAIDKHSELYIKWAKDVSSFTDNDYEDMRRFFKGFMGEYFFYRICEDTRVLVCKQEASMFTIRFASPNLPNEKDFGMDFTAIINDIPCAIQVKFWNPYINENKTELSTRTFQALAFEGAAQGFIELNDTKVKNIFFVYISDEAKAYKIINENPSTKDRVVVFGKQTFDASVNGRDIWFWDNLIASINKFGIDYKA